MSSIRYNIKNNIDTKTYIYFKPNESGNLDDIKLLLENNDKFIVDSNANSYKNVTDYIYRIITKTGFLCKGLNPKYILESFVYVDAVVIIGSTLNVLPNGNIFGFAFINFNEKTNSIYVDSICSHTRIKGAGDILINEIENIGRKLFVTKIELISVESAISFYEKYGFTKLNELCENRCSMIKFINKKGGKTRKKKTKNNKRKTKNNKRETKKYALRRV